MGVGLMEKTVHHAERRYLHAHQARAGLLMSPDEPDSVTLSIMGGGDYLLDPGTARVLAARLEKRADQADPAGARK